MPVQGLRPSADVQTSGVWDSPKKRKPAGTSPRSGEWRGVALVGTPTAGPSRIPSFARNVRAGRGRRVAFAWRKETR